MPNCLVIQHVAPESPFAIGESLTGAGFDVDIRPVFEGAEVPDGCTGFDGLVVMGGPMSARSDEGFPTRTAELGLLADAVDSGLPTLGVCLGAQLLALATGGSVSGGMNGPEVGWGPVELGPACTGDRLFDGLPDRLTVMHWHGETFEIPDGGERLMSNANYPNQCFRIGEAAWGMQFHLEVTGPAVEGFLVAFAADADAVEGGPGAVRAATPDAIERLAPWSGLVFDRFTGLVAAHAGREDLVDLV